MTNTPAPTLSTQRNLKPSNTMSIGKSAFCLSVSVIALGCVLGALSAPAMAAVPPANSSLVITGPQANPPSPDWTHMTMPSPG